MVEASLGPRGSDDLDRTIRAKFLDHPVDQPRFDQGFVALDVDDERKLFGLACYLGNPIGSARSNLLKSARLRPPN